MHFHGAIPVTHGWRQTPGTHSDSSWTKSSTWTVGNAKVKRCTYNGYVESPVTRRGKAIGVIEMREVCNANIGNVIGEIFNCVEFWLADVGIDVRCLSEDRCIYERLHLLRLPHWVLNMVTDRLDR